MFVIHVFEYTLSSITGSCNEVFSID